MTWFNRKKEFHEEATILGDDYETEFDAIADAFNGLFQAGVVEATSNKVLPEAFTDLPGATKEITVPRDSTILIVATLVKNVAAESFTHGTVNIDGSDNAALAFAVVGQLSGTQVYSADLATGAHTIKLRGRSTGIVEAVEKQSRFIYLVIPKP